jgi:hypothetical protein
MYCKFYSHCIIFKCLYLTALQTKGDRVSKQDLVDRLADNAIISAEKSFGQTANRHQKVLKTWEHGFRSHGDISLA